LRSVTVIEVRTMMRTTNRLQIAWALGAVGTVLGAGAFGPVKADTGAVDIAPQLASQFQSDYGAPLIVTNHALAPTPIDSAPPTQRLRAVELIAQDHGATWRKLFRVTPASSQSPVTTEADADGMVDQSGTVTLNLDNVPAWQAFRSTAEADNAGISMPDGTISGIISANMMNEPLPNAIAQIAARTHTHWQAIYVIAPIDGAAPEPATLAETATIPLTFQQYEATQMFNGPITIQITPGSTLPDMTTMVDATAAAVAPATTPSGAPANTAPIAGASTTTSMPLQPVVVDPFAYGFGNYTFGQTSSDTSF
jgi:hypothetical protein